MIPPDVDLRVGTAWTYASGPVSMWVSEHGEYPKLCPLRYEFEIVEARIDWVERDCGHRARVPYECWTVQYREYRDGHLDQVDLERAVFRPAIAWSSGRSKS